MPRVPARLCLALLLAVAAAQPAPPAHAAATVVREPAFGLPHLFADTDLELARENGREIARDRLAQLLLLARVGRGTLYQAFGALSGGTLGDDVAARRTGYTSSELNRMWEALPAEDRELILEYCRGVNDTIEQVYAGALPEPLEVGVFRNFVGDGDLFGNATDVSDQQDPLYLPPGGADPERPLAGFQFTPEMAMAVAVLEVRNFGFESFDEDRRLSELQALIDAHGVADGTGLWRDRNWLVDPLAPVSVPNAAAPGYGGPLAAAPPQPGGAVPAVARLAQRYPRFDFAGASRERAAAAARRAEFARRLGAWPQLGSYAWVIAADRSATGRPWLGGFPQTGIQTPSLMHFVENRSGEGIQGIGMEFVGGPFVLIGQTDHVAYTSTTAQLRVVDTFLEEVVGEDADALRHLDEGVPAPLAMRTEIIRGGSLPDQTRVFFRSHVRGGNGGTRPIEEFLGDAEGTATGGSAGALVRAGAGFDASLAGGHVALVDGTGAGQIRGIAAVPDGDTLQVTSPWTTPPDATSVFVAAAAGDAILAVAIDSALWMEESTTALGFSRMQRAASVLDVRAATRMIPSTHNFPSADHQAWNGIGSDAGYGNIAFFSAGFSRKRQGLGEDEKLLPMDGAGPNPLVVREGTAEAAGPSSLVASGLFAGLDLAPPAPNFRYDNPGEQGSEFIVLVLSGDGFKQTRRIASADADTLTVELPWGVVPSPGDHFEVHEIVAMPEAINPAEGYLANWNNKAASSDDGEGFGRNQRVAFILERLAADSSWDRDEQRQLNRDVAGLDGKGRFGRYLVPRLRQAVDAVGHGGVPEVDDVLAALEAHDGAPAFGRIFVDPVADVETRPEEAFLESLVSRLAEDVFADELGPIGVPGGEDALAMLLHAIDHEAGDVPGSYVQQYPGDYFGGAGWESVVRDALAALAPGGIPAPAPRAQSTYVHPLAQLFPALRFPPTPAGNRGTWEQIVEVGDVVLGEFVFPLGQSGLAVQQGAAAIPDPHYTSLHPVWRDWRFVPMLQVGADLEAAGTPDPDGDGVWDGYERWYFGDASPKAKKDADRDGASLAEEFQQGLDPTVSDTDLDGIPDGRDGVGQDRLAARFASLKGKFRVKAPGKDRLQLAGKLGTGSPALDPDANDLSITVRDDDGVLWEATLPAGTLSTKNGRTYRYDGASGAVPDLQKLKLRLGRKPEQLSRLKLETVKTDFSGLALDDRDVRVELAVGERTVSDERLWRGRRRGLEATR